MALQDQDRVPGVAEAAQVIEPVRQGAIANGDAVLFVNPTKYTIDEDLNVKNDNSAFEEIAED